MTALLQDTEARDRAGAPACVACGCVRTSLRGRTRLMDSRFGRALGRGRRQVVELWGCPRCGLVFRHPMPPAQALARAYRSASADIWQGADHAYWADVRAQLKLHAPGPRVLDVGCYRGGFLAQLGPEWQKLGVEPSEAAASEARRRGSDVIADELAAVPATAAPFDALVMLDLLEHLTDPLAELRTATGLLRPGGIIVVSTGDGDALAWRLHGTDYYYVAMPEHLTFYRQRWFEWLTRRLPLELLTVQRFRHGGWRALPFLRWLVRYLAYLPVPLYQRFRLRPDRSPFMWRYYRLVQHLPPQGAPHAKDHMLVVLRKTGGASVRPQADRRNQ